MGGMAFSTTRRDFASNTQGSKQQKWESYQQNWSSQNVYPPVNSSLLNTWPIVIIVDLPTKNGGSFPSVFCRLFHLKTARGISLFDMWGSERGPATKHRPKRTPEVMKAPIFENKMSRTYVSSISFDEMDEDLQVLADNGQIKKWRSVVNVPKNRTPWLHQLNFGKQPPELMRWFRRE